jgi:hypothetical protein
MPVHHDQEAAENEHSERATQPHYVRHDRAVLSGTRVVVIAIEQYLVSQRSDLVLRGLYNA